jgi:phage protein U
MTPLLAIGPHIFEIFPLNLQKIEEETNVNWPAVERFGTGPARQFTGQGETTFKIEGLCFNEEFGGYTEYLALKATAAAGQPLDIVGWGAGAAYGLVIGPACILKVSATHEAIGPDGIGRKITFHVECGAFGESFGGGLFG